jgi:CxxC motif-containing protein (DUF1111 family)
MHSPCAPSPFLSPLFFSKPNPDTNAGEPIPNYVWDAVDNRTALGRFGWKANQPSLKPQIAAAAIGDIGEELAEGRPDFKAGWRDWRTPPLWAQGLSQTVSGSTAMLHMTAVPAMSLRRFSGMATKRKYRARPIAT